MTNLEKYFDEIKTGNLYDDLCVAILKVKNQRCDINNNNCEYCKKYQIIKWLLQEYKEPIKLKKVEKVILENINNKFKYISRDYDKRLYCSTEKPKKDEEVWVVCDEYCNFSLYNHLFQFVKWEDKEPYSIEGILNNCEVIDDD